MVEVGIFAEDPIFQNLTAVVTRFGQVNGGSNDQPVILKIRRK
jgi:hypothetical protein